MHPDSDKDVVRSSFRSEDWNDRLRDADAQVRAMSDLLDRLKTHDDATFTHVRSVGRWCRRLATELGGDARQADFVERCGTLHDVGKIRTPLEVLRKPAALDPSELEIMRRHAQDGADMCAATPGLERFAEIVRSHHERPDGRGYPRGLGARDIPVESQIVAVADAFHAMISRRSYVLHTKTPLEALAELERGSGSQFTPSVVLALFTIVGYRGQTAAIVRRRQTG
jgi:putative nucleotidyltransferase with HDIG domain